MVTSAAMVCLVPKTRNDERSAGGTGRNVQIDMGMGNDVWMVGARHGEAASNSGEET